MLSKFYKAVCKIETIICSAAFISIVALVLTAAIFRAIERPIQWSIDAAQLLFAWAAFLGADIAIRNKSLVGVGIFTSKLKINTQIKIRTICNIIIVFVLIALIVYGFQLSLSNWKRSFQTLPVSYGFVTLSLPISSIFMVFSTIGNIKQDIAELRGKKA